MSDSKDRVMRFLDHLDGIFQREPEFHPFEPLTPGQVRVVSMVYRDVPEPGYITGITYGLSEVEHPAWTQGRPELIVSLASDDLAWPLAVGDLANQLRGNCPFCYGDVINFGGPVAAESEMSAFFVFAPAILEREDFLNIDVGGSKPISLAGIYPIYDSEREVLARIGLKDFWHHDAYDLYSVKRPAISIQ